MVKLPSPIRPNAFEMNCRFNAKSSEAILDITLRYNEKRSVCFHTEVKLGTNEESETLDDFLAQLEALVSSEVFVEICNRISITLLQAMADKRDEDVNLKSVVDDYAEGKIPFEDFVKEIFNTP
jgi:hypothetical protein